MPATVNDVSLTGDWSKTLGGDCFLVKSEDNVHVLATDDNIKLLAEAEELYMDGTFKSSPRLFHQVYTIHVFKHGKQFLVVYCLLPGKSRDVYAKVFTILSDAMDDLLLQPQFTRVTSDFELAMIQEVKTQFSFVNVKGCFFHYAQASWRKVQSLGLQEEYKSNPDMNKMVSKMLSLSLCPIQFVRVSWSSIKSAAPQVQNIDDLCKYYEDTWLNGNVPIASWNHYATEGPRTNNHVEGWHKKLNTVAGKTHPNVFEIVKVFQQEQAMTEVALQQLAVGGAIRRRNKFYRVKDTSIKRVKDKFVAGTYTLDEYIEQVSKWMGFL